MESRKGSLMKAPDWARYWTADAVAECLSYYPKDKDKMWALYNKLWRFVNEAKNKTPAGGDGSNGTVETPDGRLDLENDDKVEHWWGRLDDEDRKELKTAFAIYAFEISEVK